MARLRGELWPYPRIVKHFIPFGLLGVRARTPDESIIFLGRVLGSTYSDATLDCLYT